jgi:hypothetical protein
MLSSSTAAETHLQILRSLVTPSSSTPVLGDSGSEFALTMTTYLLSQQLYARLGHAIAQIVSPELNFPPNYNTSTFAARREERPSSKSTPHHFSDNIDAILLSKSDNRATVHSHSYDPPITLSPTTYTTERTLFSPPSIIDSSPVTSHLHWILTQRSKSTPNY